MASAMSPCGVEVACALTWTMSAGVDAGVREGELHRPGGARSDRVGLGDVVTVGGDTRSRRPRRRCGRRAPRACASDSRTRIPAPSPNTKPSRPLSYGRDARSGSSLRLESAIIAAKAAMGTGCRQASVPPAMTTSARPLRIICRAYATASAPDAQADTGVCTPARAENSRPTYAAGPLGMSIGIVCGETLRGPFSRRSVPLAEQGLRATDAGGDDDAEPQRVDVRRAGVGPGLARGDQGKLLGAVEACVPRPGP